MTDHWDILPADWKDRPDEILTCILEQRVSGYHTIFERLPVHKAGYS